MSRSGGLKPRAVAGRPSVTKLTHKSCTGMRASGKPRAAVRKILSPKRRVLGCSERRVCDEVPLPDDFTDVGGNEVTDKLLHVVVDGTTFFNCGHNGREVVVGQDHLGGRLGDSGTRTHGNTNFGLLQGRGVVDTVTSHGRDLTISLKELNNFTLVSGLHSREEACSANGGPLFADGKVVEFSARVGHASGILVLFEDANTTADSFGGSLVITSDDNDTDASHTALNNRVEDFLSRRIQHTTDTNKCHVLLAKGVVGWGHMGQVSYRWWRSTQQMAYLIVGKLGGVGQIHCFRLHWGVKSGQSQASKGVTACTVTAGDIKDSVADGRGHGKLAVTNTNVGASVEDTFRSALEEKKGNAS